MAKVLASTDDELVSLLAPMTGTGIAAAAALPDFGDPIEVTRDANEGRVEKESSDVCCVAWHVPVVASTPSAPWA